MRMPPVTWLCAALCAPLVVAGCGDRVASAGPSPASYDGPLQVSRDEAAHPGAGAAGDVVDCLTWGDGGAHWAEVYGEGATAGSPEGALEVAASERGFGGSTQGLVVAKEEGDRVLYVLEVDGVRKQAVIVRDGPATEGAGGPGWHVESWAHCDHSELPRSFTDSIGLTVWEDASGDPVPTSQVASWRGPEHCDWQSMTFLHLGEEARYVRHPAPGLGDWLAGPYRPSVPLPADAVDTGFATGGDRLWLSADGQVAYVGRGARVEAWPRALEDLACA